MPPNIVERIFQLASDCASIKELRRKLHGEGYALVSIDMHLNGLGIRRELRTRFNGGTGPKKRGPNLL